MSKFMITEKDREKIHKVMQAAESKTSGEIAVAYTHASSHYAFFELLFSVLCGFMYFLILLFFITPIEYRVQSIFWDYHHKYLVMFYGFSTFLVIFIFYFFTNIPWITRLLVPKKIMRRMVNERAVRYFMESGVYHTHHHIGILIFISYLERQVEILADRGISAKIPQEKWDALIQHIIAGIKNDCFVERLIEAINQCGTILAQHFPIRPDDRNELDDGIAILEK